MINGNVDPTYLFPQNEEGFYHVKMTERIPLGGMEFEDRVMIQKFDVANFKRLELDESKAARDRYRKREVLHDPLRVEKLKRTNTEQVVHKNLTRSDLLSFIRESGETMRGNPSTQTLIEKYEQIKSTK